MKNKYIILTLVMALRFGGVIAQDWELLNSGTEFHLYQITFPPNQKMIGYAAGSEYHNPSDGIILKTTDGGDTWNQIYPKQEDGIVESLHCIWFVNEKVGYAGGLPNLLLKTTDGGQSWVEVTNLPENSNLIVNFVEFYNENTGIVKAVRDGGGDFYVTRDGGLNWAKASEFNSAGQPLDVSYKDETTLQLITQVGNVWTSNDAGLNWWEDTWLPIGKSCIDHYGENTRIVGGFRVIS
ncbi:MAG: YCF48-related protein [Carboxylicivirga sp.]|nr:YCF48-related protein [Carboxylicivirga sp.]